MIVTTMTAATNMMMMMMKRMMMSIPVLTKAIIIIFFQYYCPHYCHHCPWIDELVWVILISNQLVIPTVKKNIMENNLLHLIEKEDVLLILLIN